MIYKYELCICIPTFNRADEVFNLVNGILKSKNEKLTIVVLDNASPDNTLNQLERINDSRLNVFSNEQNKGSLYNFINVLNKVDNAKYALFCLDKDKLNIEHIDRFISNLEGSNAVGGYVYHGDGLDTECNYNLWHEFNSGYSAIKNIAYLGRHPSGYFFNVQKLSEINFVERYSDKNIVGLFPFEFILADLLVRDKGAIYFGQLIKTESLENARKTKSFTINGNLSTAYFHPRARAKQAANFCLHVSKLKLSKLDKLRLGFNNFKNGLLVSTVGYRAIMKNSDICTHHYIRPRNISTIETIYNTFLFCIIFSIVMIKNSIDDSVM